MMIQIYCFNTLISTDIGKSLFDAYDIEEAKDEELKEQQKDKVKRSVVHGDTASELVKSIQVVDWDKVAEEVRPRTGGKTDFGV